MSNEPEHRGRWRLTLTINVVHFSVRPIPSEVDQMRRAVLFILLLLIAAAVGAPGTPHHGGKSANPSWLYSWARPRTVVVSQRPPAPGTTDALTPLERAGTPVLRTWQRGAIHFRWTPDGIITQAPPRGQTEFQVNLKLGLTPCPPRMAFPELLPARVTYGVPVTLALGCPRNSRGTLGAARAALGSTD